MLNVGLALATAAVAALLALGGYGYSLKLAQAAQQQALTDQFRQLYGSRQALVTYDRPAVRCQLVTPLDTLTEYRFIQLCGDMDALLRRQEPYLGLPLLYPAPKR